MTIQEHHHISSYLSPVRVRLLLTAALVGSSSFPVIAFAQTSVSGPVSGTLVQVLAVVNTLIPILLALAVLVFFWGIVKFIANASDPEARAGGLRHIIGGMIGLFVMVAFWGIIGYVQQSLGLTPGTVTTSPPPVVEVIPTSQ